MGDFFRNLFDTDGFVPRRNCGEWTPGLISLHTTSDILIWLAYLSIPLVLWFFARQRKDLPFSPVIWLFGAFILACGFTHLLEAMMFTTPVYRLSGAVKLVTAAVSWATVLALIPAVPKVLAWLDRKDGLAARPADPAGRPDARGRHYAVAVLAAGLAVVLRLMLDPLLGNAHLFILPLVSVVFMAWYGGFGPALVALGIGLAVTAYLFAPPRQSFRVDGVDNQIGMGLFLFCGVAASLLGEAQRVARRRQDQSVEALRATNAELARSERRAADALAQLETFLAAAPIGLAFYDAELRPVRVNKYLAEVHPGGGTPSFPPHLVDEFRTVLRTGEPVRDRPVSAAAGSDGAATEWVTDAHPVRDPGGGPLGLVVVAQDVTERRAGERRLRESEARKAAVLETALDCVVTIDHEGRVVEFNPAAERTFGYRRDEVLGRDMADHLLPPAMRAAHRGGMSRYLATRESRVLDKRLELSAVRRDGTEFPVELSITPTWVDGRPMFTSYLRDITDRKRAEERLRESEARFRELAESLPLLIWTCRADGCCDYLSRQWVEYTGRPEAEQVGPGWLNAVHPDDRDRVAAAWATAVATAGRFEIEFRIRRADGAYRWFYTRAVPLRDAAGRVTKWLGTNTDIDDLKRVRENLREGEARFRFLDAVAQGTRAAADPAAVMAATTRLLGEHLGVTRCAYADVEPDGDRFAIRHDWTDGAMSTVGEYSLDLFGPRAAADMRAGRTLVVRDVDRELAPADGADTFNAIGVKAIVCCPLVRDGRLAAMMAVHQAGPRDWTAAEVALVEAVVERSWAHVERARAARTLRESEAKFRTLADSIPQLAWMARPDGHIFWYNRRWYEYTGTTFEEMEGWDWEKVLDPAELKRMSVTWRHALATGQPWEDTFPLRRHDGEFRWHLSRARPVRDADGSVALWFGTNTDIDDQKAQEDRQRFLVELADATRGLREPAGVLAAVAERAGRHFRVSRATYGEIDAAQEHVIVDWDYCDGVPSVAGRHRLDDFGPEIIRELKAGQTVAVADTATDPRTASHVVAFAGISTRSLLCVPLVQGGRFVALFVLHHWEPRAWTRHDVALLEQVAERTWPAAESARAEAGLRASEARYRTLTESIPQLVWNADAAGRVTYLNARWTEYTGLTQAAAGDNWWGQVAHPDDAARLGAAWQQAVADWPEPFTEEVRVRRAADGTYRWFLTAAVPLRRPDGSVDQWIGSLSDIDDQKRQAERLEELVRGRTAELNNVVAALKTESAERQRQREFLDAILDNVADGIVACDGDGRLTLFNRASREFHGLPAEPLPADQWAGRYDLYRADGRTPLPTDDIPLVRALRGERVRDAEMVIAPRDGPPRSLLASGQPLADPAGRKLGAVVSMRDVTERKRLEDRERAAAVELRRSNDELEKFAYVASHDLQEPLRKIQAFGDRLAKRYRQAIDDQGQEYLDRMLASAGRMRTLIDDLLAFSRVTTKPNPFARVELAAVVRDVLSDLEERVAETDARVSVGPLPAVVADPGQMRQLFQNLIGNALKFHKPDTPAAVAVAATPFADVPAAADPPAPRGAGWRITVTDNGIGFDQQYADRIFEVFQRLHGRGEYEGTGIGLAICRKIAERHGGTIAARGRLGEGAAFVIDLPAAAGPGTPE